MQQVPYCFACWAGGPVTPPPCRRCGSTQDYFTSGLCARCHPHAPGGRTPGWTGQGRATVVDACPDCLAWGVTRTLRWLCSGCKAWREKHRTVQACHSCARVLPADAEGICRPCRKQRGWVARQRGIRVSKVDIVEANRHGQQLFIADTFHQPGYGRTPYRKKSVPADLSLLRPVGHEQLVLFEAARDLRLGLTRGFPAPRERALEAAFQRFTADYGIAHHWPKTRTDVVISGIRIMLGIQDTPGAAIRRSDVALLARIKRSVIGVAEVLQAAGILADDQIPAVDRWFPLQIAELPAAMRSELSEWFAVMRHGSAITPRRRPRLANTASSQLRWAMPALQRWAERVESLREIARDDVLAVLPPDARQRRPMLIALRSIFTVLKGRRLVFVNPTSRISNPIPEPVAPSQPDFDALRRALDSDKPAESLLTALLAFHAVRLRQLGSIRMTDVRNGRLYLEQCTVLLAPPVRQRLNAYLDYRQRMWPNSINPYLFIGSSSASPGSR